MGIDTLSEEVWLAVPKGNLFIANEDAPTVAAELLKAAGHLAIAELVEAEDADRMARAEREAVTQKLQERRDKIARDIGERYDGIPAGSYHTGTWRERVAIDRIIELEDGKTTA